MSENASNWGTIPQAVVDVAQMLSARAETSNEGLQRAEWPSEPRDVQPLLRKTISDAHKISKAATELRSLLTAYAHQFHEPRPVMSDLAKAQDATRQSIPRRYNQAMVDAIRELLSEEPNTAIIRHALTSLTRTDLERVHGAVGEIARRENAGEIEKPTLSASTREPVDRRIKGVALRKRQSPEL